MVLRGAVEEGVGCRESQGTAGAVVVKPAGSGQVMQFFFRDERTQDDRVNVSGTVFRRRPGS